MMSTINGLLTLISSVCSPIYRFMFCFRGILNAEFKDLVKWDRLCRRYTIAEMNIILLYHKNINREIFKGFLDQLAVVDEKPKEV